MLKITFTKISLSYTRRRANHIRAGYIGLPMVPLPRLQISAVHDSFQFLTFDGAQRGLSQINTPFLLLRL